MSKEKFGQDGGENMESRGVERYNLFGPVDSMRGKINKNVMAVLATIGFLTAAGGGVWLYNEVPKAKEAAKEQLIKELTELIKRNVDVFKVMLTFLEEYVKVFGKSALDKVFNGDVVGLIGQLQQGVDGAEDVYNDLVTDITEIVTCYQNSQLKDVDLPVLKKSLQECTNPGQLIVGLGKLPGITNNAVLSEKYKNLVNTNAALQSAINEKLSVGYAQKLFWEHLFGSNTAAGNEVMIDTDTSWMNIESSGPNNKPPVAVDVDPTEPSQVQPKLLVQPVQLPDKALPETPEVLEVPTGYGAGDNR